MLEIKYLKEVGIYSTCSHDSSNGPLGYERMYLPLCKVADTSFHIQGGALKVVFLEHHLLSKRDKISETFALQYNLHMQIKYFFRPQADRYTT